MKTRKPLDEQYFTWLYGHIGTLSTKNPARNYWNLARQLYKKEFVYFIPNDDNRAEDGIALREEFLREHSSESGADAAWESMGCSFLEMLIALARRIAFEEYDGDGDSTGEWFWKLMSNLNLERYSDALEYDGREKDIDRLLEAVNNRTYHRDGVGGLFPLLHPTTDQRTTEIWYQMSAYLTENDSDTQ